MIKRIVLFLIVNFLGLAIGSLFTSDAVFSDWHLGLNKAPWTPPGWVFGAAWTTIMICFSVYLGFFFNSIHQKRKRLLFGLQWILNVGWSPLFFYFHAVGTALLCISLLTILIAYLMFNDWKEMKMKSLLLLPYLVWLIIATSLNSYILFYN